MRKQVSFALALSMVMTSGMATVANAAADDGKTNVVFWNSWTGGDGDTLEALVNKFNEESDTVHVEMTRPSVICFRPAFQLERQQILFYLAQMRLHVTRVTFAPWMTSGRIRD